jgi:type II secretory pathway pseudopilin PulG
MKHKTKKKYFTLLELLVIVGILAIVGGSMIAAYDGLTAQAAKAGATNSIAALTNTVRAYKVQEGELPNNVESLLAATPDSPTYNATTLDSTTVVTSAHKQAALLGSKLKGKFDVQELTVTQLENLEAAGIDTVRYLDLGGNDEDSATELTIVAADGTTASGIGDISDITIPQHAFSAPRPNGTSNGRNRGRGFAHEIDAETTNSQAFAIWAKQSVSAPDANYNNVKVGAKPDAVLVMLGIGPESSLVDNYSNSDGAVGDVRLASAPYYGDVGKNEYAHYIMLVDVTESPAQFVAVVDPRGDFLAEEFAESTGQKQ